MLSHHLLISLFHLSPWSQHSKPISHSLSSPSFTPSPCIASVRAAVRTELLFLMSSPRKLSRCGQWVTGLTRKICKRTAERKAEKSKRKRKTAKLQSNKSYWSHWSWFSWQWDQTKTDTGRAQMSLLQSSQHNIKRNIMFRAFHKRNNSNYFQKFPYLGLHIHIRTPFRRTGLSLPPG